MFKSLHEIFDESERMPAPSDILPRHQQSAMIIHRLKEILYALPASRHLIEFMNFHGIPAWVEVSDIVGFRVRNKQAVILSCPEKGDLPLSVLALHLASGLRVVEIHTPTYRPPEMNDSKDWLHPHLTEPFEIMLTICRIAHDMNFNAPDKDVMAFLKEHELEPVYQAWVGKQPLGQLEALMLENFNKQH